MKAACRNQDDEMVNGDFQMNIETEGEFNALLDKQVAFFFFKTVEEAKLTGRAGIKIST